MFLLLLPFLKKFTPYFAAAALLFAAGGYVGYRFEYGAVEAAKLALLAQQKSDASAAAAANALATTYLAERNSKDNLAESSLAAAETKLNATETALSVVITSKAEQPGQDAADAPVLAAILDDMAKDNP